MNRKLIIPALGALLAIAGGATVAMRRGAPAEAPAVTLDAPHTVSAQTEVGAAPAFAVSSAGRQAAAWVSAPGGGSDGSLYVSVDGAAPIVLRDSLGPIEAHGEAPPKLAYAANGDLYALYVVGKVVPGRRFPLSALRLARAAGGRAWDAPVTVTDDSTFGSHNFHALHLGRDGAIYVAWLDGREGKSAAFIARSGDGGRTWSANRRIDADGEACPCCRTGVATAKDGTIYVAWRGVLAGGIRDVVIARSADAGATWSEPVRVHADDWRIDMCPHAGPSVQVGDDGVVHVAWWTGRSGRAGVQYARSADGGRTFDAPVALGVAEFSQPAHVQLALGADGLVAAAWEDGTRKTPPALLRVSRDGGRTFGPASELSAPGRAAGYPVLALVGDRVTVAWTEKGAKSAAHEAHEKAARPHGSAPEGLPTVGDAQVVVRTGRLR